MMLLKRFWGLESYTTYRSEWALKECGGVGGVPSYVPCALTTVSLLR